MTFPSGLSSGRDGLPVETPIEGPRRSDRIRVHLDEGVSLLRVSVSHPPSVTTFLLGRLPVEVAPGYPPPTTCFRRRG